MKCNSLLSAFALMLVPLYTAVSQTMSAQTSSTVSAASAYTAVPPLVPYSGVALDASGRSVASPTSITFLVFKDETGGEPLFAETQSLVVDATGHYKVQLGATLANGLPSDLFATGEARWLEVQIAGFVDSPIFVSGSKVGIGTATPTTNNLRCG